MAKYLFKARDAPDLVTGRDASASSFSFVEDLETAAPGTQSVEFRRAEGEGNASQRWIDSNLPVCPMCRSPSLWRVASAVDQEALVRWFFQCPNCMVVLSTIPNVPVSALAEPVNVPKAALTTNLRVERVERKEDEDFVGEEFPLYELQEWAAETGT